MPDSPAPNPRSARTPYLGLSDFLLAAHVTLDDLHSAVTEALPLGPEDVVAVCGSATEGLATRYADIDILIVTDRSDLVGAADIGKLAVLNGLRLDIRTFPERAVEGLLDRVADWRMKGYDCTQISRFNDDDRRLLFRIASGVPLQAHEKIATWIRQCGLADLTRMKIAHAVRSSQTGLLDLAGMAADGDWASLIYNARDLLNHAFDAILAAHGEANPSPKWRMRLLEKLPTHWSDRFAGPAAHEDPVTTYFALSAQPAILQADACLAHACRIAAWARRVVPSIHAGAAFAEARGQASTDTAPASLLPLPCLDLDVTVRWIDGDYRVFRAHANTYSLRLNQEQFDILAHFDGLSRVDPAAYKTGLVEEMLALVRWAELAEKNPYPHSGSALTADQPIS